MSLFLLLASLFLHSLRLSFAYENPRHTLCNDITANSTFSANVALALATLRETTGFNATTVGNPANQSVSALALCRGTISSSECQTCVRAATSGIRSACPDQTEAQVWYTLCTVRYSVVNIIGKLDYTISFTDPSGVNAPARNLDAYVQKVKFLMQNLSLTASASDTRYAVGKTNISSVRSVYGYVDCSRDINGSDCITCLLNTIRTASDCCLGRRSAWIATPTCNIQVNTKPVHDDWINNPPEINTDMVGGGGGGGGSRAGGKKIGILVAVVVTVLIILVVGVIILVVRWRKKRDRVKRAKEMKEVMTMREDMGINSFLYDFEVLVAATDNFSSANRLGGGGFGTVYRGKLPNGKEIAVKKLDKGSVQGVEEFYSEVKVLINRKHRNLVRLLGCCLLGEERILVYEYFPNKSLDHTLFDKTRSALLDWPKRYNIVVGVARGLLYLHEDSLPRIIHRDIKASNVLLDEQMHPKISDFGLAKFFADEQSQMRTKHIAGTPGYMAPEYVNQGFLTVKSDVFSFGVLALEIISGRKNYDTKFNEEEQGLSNLARRLEQEGRLMELVDATMGTFSQNETLRCMRIGLLCCQEHLNDRPTVSSTLAMLSNHSVPVPSTKRPGYHDTNNTMFVQAETHTSGNGDCSTNPGYNCFTEISITTSLDSGTGR